MRVPSDVPTYIPIVIWALGVVVLILTGVAKYFHGELKDLRANQLRQAEAMATLQQHIAEAYVRTPEVQRLERTLEAMAVKIDGQFGSVRAEVSKLSQAVWELVGSRKVT